MRALSNVEFEKLAATQGYRLKTLARVRCDQNPKGFVSVQDLQDYAQSFAYSGDPHTATWLKNLVVLTKNGTINRLRYNQRSFTDHRKQVAALKTTGKIAFDIGDHVFIRDCGRYGSVIDYLPNTKEYMVVLDPFQFRSYPKDHLEKVAQWVETRYVDTPIQDLEVDIQQKGWEIVDNGDGTYTVGKPTNNPEKVVSGTEKTFNSLEELQSFAWDVASGKAVETAIPGEFTAQWQETRSVQPGGSFQEIKNELAQHGYAVFDNGDGTYTAGLSEVLEPGTEQVLQGVEEVREFANQLWEAEFNFPQEMMKAHREV